MLSRHEDVIAALLDHDTYSSVNGVFPTPPDAPFLESFLPMMITMDPPRHDQLRGGLVSKAFTPPRRIVALETGIDQLAASLVERLTSSGSEGRSDFVADLAGILPAVVIADLLGGIPREDRQQFRQWSSTLIQSNPARGEVAEGLAAAAAVYAYFADFLADRRKAPRDDLMSALVAAEIDGQRLSDDELLGFCLLLLIAGHETTTNLLANAAVVLAGHPPRSRHRLAADPTLIGQTVEELLRYDSPVQGLSRVLTTDVTLHGGATMSQGDSVLLLFGSANRDERVFARPDVFDIDRKPEHQVAFGRGYPLLSGSCARPFRGSNCVGRIVVTIAGLGSRCRLSRASSFGADSRIPVAAHHVAGELATLRLGAFLGRVVAGFDPVAGSLPLVRWAARKSSTICVQSS